MAIATDTLRLGHRYWMKNHGEETVFELVSIKNKDDYMVREINTREVFNLKDLTRYGVGKDYDLREME